MFIDTHAHLSFPDFASDLPATVARAAAAGVTRIVSVATDLADTHRVLTVAGQYPGVFASVGLHPNHTSDSWRADMQELAGLAGQPKVVAIGETGLDYYRTRDHAVVQREMFQAHLDLVRQRHLPVIIHCRAADADTLAMVRANVPDWRPWGVMHCFAGNTQVALECIELGLLISFTGILTFKNADALREVAGAVPLESMLLETDAPYLAPIPQRGQRNEPASIPHIAGTLAQLKGVPVEEVARVTTKNAQQLFGLPSL
ncbi:MAG: TatD family hydrolase [Verrucomicrobiota bacterium]